MSPSRKVSLLTNPSIHSRYEICRNPGLPQA
jgi:hypothetical protein